MIVLEKSSQESTSIRSNPYFARSLWRNCEIPPHFTCHFHSYIVTGDNNLLLLLYIILYYLLLLILYYYYNINDLFVRDRSLVPQKFGHADQDFLPPHVQELSFFLAERQWKPQVRIFAVIKINIFLLSKKKLTYFVFLLYFLFLIFVCPLRSVGPTTTLLFFFLIPSPSRVC